MKMILKTSNKTIVERAERHDRRLDADTQRGEVVDILIAALAANGIKLCGDSDIKWGLFEAHLINRLHRMRGQIPGTKRASLSPDTD